jgi:meso-butanediol dehydrogenase / (S,S)-butanediol dehydrogenase / diacetyl reductase
MDSLKGKTAIVTGGGRGIGRGVALALAAEGASVVVAGRTEAPLVDTCRAIEERGGRATHTVCDITVGADVDRCIEVALATFGGIDVLVNNAALIPQGNLLEVSEDLVRSALDAGPVATWRFMCRCHPHLRGGGTVVNVSSGAAIVPSAPKRGVYAMAKAGLNAVSRAAAMECAADDIRVNVIMPFAATDAVDQFLDEEPAHADQIVGSVPLGRIGDPEHDIGRAVVFLAGPDSGYLTGATLPLDGGLAYVR